MQTENGHPLVRWFKRWVLRHVWYVQSPYVIVIRATPSTALQMLKTASRPSTDRLHLRSVFMSGRRYQFQMSESGFRLQTTSKVSWHYRRRTSSAAILNANFVSVNNDVTRIQLQSRIRLSYFLNVLFIPVGIGTIIVYVPWNPLAIAAILIFLFLLSWIGHRSQAALEAQEMLYFIQKALEDLDTGEIPSLSSSSSTSNVIYSEKAFERAWERFYEDHKGEVTSQ